MPSRRKECRRRLLSRTARSLRAKLAYRNAHLKDSWWHVPSFLTAHTKNVFRTAVGRLAQSHQHQLKGGVCRLATGLPVFAISSNRLLAFQKICLTSTKRPAW